MNSARGRRVFIPMLMLALVIHLCLGGDLTGAAKGRTTEQEQASLSNPTEKGGDPSCAVPGPQDSDKRYILASGDRWRVIFERSEGGPVLYFCVDGVVRHREEPVPRSTLLIEQGAHVVSLERYPRDLLVTLWTQGAKGSSIRIYDPLDMHDPLVFPPETSRSDAIRVWQEEGYLCFEVFKMIYHTDREDELEKKIHCFPERE